MFKNEYTISIDIKRTMTAIVPAFVQYDNAVLIFKIYDDGKPFDFSGFTKAEVTHKRPDKVIVLGQAEKIDVNGEEVIKYTYLGNEMSKTGYVETSLALFSTDKKVTTLPFKVQIVTNLQESAAQDSQKEIGVLQDLIAQVEDLTDLVIDATTNANDKADYAQTQGDYAKTQGDYAKQSGDDTEAIRIATEQERLDTEAVRLATEDVKTQTELVKTQTEAVRVETITAKNDAITATNNANQATQDAIAATQNTIQATNDANQATQDAINATNNANSSASNADNKAQLAQTAADNADAKAQLADTKAQLADDKASLAQTAANNANTATDAINLIMPNVEGLEPKGSYDPDTLYKKNNFIEFNGSGYQALKDTQGNPPPTPPQKVNEHWMMLSQRGVDGTGSVSSVNNIFPDVDGNVDLGNLTTSWNDLQGKPTEFPPSPHNHNVSDINGLSTVAKTGSYNDLLNIPINLETTTGAQAKVDTHADKKDNPHNVTKAQVGLSNVDNVKQASKVEFDNHVGSKNNPHQVTASQVGAYTKEETDDKIGILSESLTNLETEIQATDDRVSDVEDDFVEHKAESATKFNLVHRHNTAQDKEIAYLKLKQEADDRIENGTTFADDFLGNRFGMEFNENESENVILRDGGLIMAASTMEEINVEDATVVNEAYDTSGNGGRKLVRLDNGWLVTLLIDVNSKIFKLYRSRDNGDTWEQIGERLFAQTTSNGVAIESIGNYVYLLMCSTNTAVQGNYYDVIDASDLSRTATSTINLNPLDAGQTGGSVQSPSLAINKEGTELHATWSSKNSQYPNSFNIRYAKGVISEIDGSVTWGAIEQVTNVNGSTYPNAYTNPSIIVVDNIPTILVSSEGIEFISSGTGISAGTNKRSILVMKRNRELLSTLNNIHAEWSATNVYINTNSYTQSYPSAIFVPPEINGLPQGRIWVVWAGTDSTDSTRPNIRVSHSDNGGINWSPMEKLTSGNTRAKNSASITVNKNNTIHIVFNEQVDTTSFSELSRMENIDGVWSSIIPITRNSTAGRNNPSTLYDISFSLDFSEPLFIYQDNENSKVGFYGTWTEGTETPTTTGTAVYDLPSTDYVGAFVQQEGNVNIEAYVNDELMESDLENDEYMLTKELDIEAPVKLRLQLSRADTSGGNNDKVTRILGGIA